MNIKNMIIDTAHKHNRVSNTEFVSSVGTHYTFDVHYSLEGTDTPMIYARWDDAHAAEQGVVFKLDIETGKIINSYCVSGHKPVDLGMAEAERALLKWLEQEITNE
jgi:hypothetical protein